MSKIYIVKEGKVKGAFFDWEGCKESVTGHPGALYKSFKIGQSSECLNYIQGIELSNHDLSIFKSNVSNFFGLTDVHVDGEYIPPEPKLKKKTVESNEPYPDYAFYAADAGTNGNDTNANSTCEFQIYCSIEDRMVHASDKMIGTNNIAEFLGIVKVIALMEAGKLDKRPIFSDSEVAIKWVNQRNARTTLKNLSKDHENTLNSISVAENYLESARSRGYEFVLKKWETKQWGENPADYGRK